MAKADIAFGIAASFLSGVLFASFHTNFYAVAAAAFCAWGICLLLLRTRAPSKKYFSVFFALIVFGFFYYLFSVNLRMVSQRLTLGSPVSFSGVIIKEPQLTEKTQQIILETSPPFRGNIAVVSPRAPEFKYGDVLSVRGAIGPAASEDKFPTALFPRVELIREHAGNRGIEALISLKQSFLAQFKNFLPADAAALMGGIILGARNDFTNDFKNQLALSGTTHIVALSGYNITILVLAVAAVFERWLSRRHTFYLTTIFIVLFVLMTGAEASAVRAAIMGFLVLLAREIGRLYSFRNAIVFAATAMVFADPTLLRFNVGFQLSFLSLLGIVYVAPALAALLHFKAGDSGFLNWRENLVNTFGAQLMVIPLLMIVFGQFSLTSFLANILILEFMPLTMLLGFLLGTLSFVWSAFGFLVGLAAYPLLRYEIWIIQFFSKERLPLANNAVSWVILTLFYAGLLSFVARYHEKKSNPQL